MTERASSRRSAIISAPGSVVGRGPVMLLYTVPVAIVSLGALAAWWNAQGRPKWKPLPREFSAALVRADGVLERQANAGHDRAGGAYVQFEPAVG